MGLLAWRAHQSTSTTGTGTVTLNPVVASRRSFQTVFGSSPILVKYVISGTDFYEMGIGSFDGGYPGTLTRPSGNVLASSNAGVLINLPVGNADVFTWIDPGDKKTVEGSGNITLTVADLGNLVIWSGTTTNNLVLPDAATVPINSTVVIRNQGTAAFTIVPTGTVFSNTGGNLILMPAQTTEIIKQSSGWFAYLNSQRIVGEIMWAPITTQPPGFYWCNGQNVSRTAHSQLFALLGTTFGAGDGSTTFGLPDMRGRALFGKDDMGGTAAGRLTTALSNVNGALLGATGGSQELAYHNHGITDPGHSHGVTDPGHAHTVAVGGVVGSNYSVLTNGFGSNIVSGTNTTGISINSGTTGITVQYAGVGGSANVPPALIMNAFIFSGY